MTYRKPRYGQIFAGHDEGEKWAEFARVLWAEAVGDLEAMGLVTPARLRIVDRYVRTSTEYEMRYSVISLVGPTHRSDNGNMYANMEWAALRALNEQATKLEENLLIAPRTAKDKVEPQPPKPTGAKADSYLDRSTTH